VTLPELIVLIPAFNEEPRLAGVLERIAALDQELEMVVVDDGSRDATGAVAARCGATVLRHPFNMGYGAALQTGYKYALERGARYLVQMDADGQHDPAQVATLLEPVRGGEADLVIGSRFLVPTAYHMGGLKTFGRKLFQGVARGVGLRVTDPTSGLQAMNRAVMEIYVEDFFPPDYPDLDVLLIAHRRGVRIREVSAVMSAGERPSTLHGGLRSFYYVYRMLLALFAATRSTEKAR